MRAAKDIEAFLKDPLGSYLTGPRWLVFADGPVSGMVVWESPTPEDSANVVRTLPASLSRGPHGYYIDARRLAQTIDPESFSLVMGEAGPTLPQYEQVERCAVVLPAGMGAAVLMGFFKLIETPFEVRFSTWS